MAYSDSPSDRLAAVRTAIGKVLNGQEYRVGNRVMRYANLALLYQMEKDLEWAVADASGTSSLVPVQIDKPGPGV